MVGPGHGAVCSLADSALCKCSGTASGTPPPPGPGGFTLCVDALPFLGTKGKVGGCWGLRNCLQFAFISYHCDHWRWQSEGKVGLALACAKGHLDVVKVLLLKKDIKGINKAYVRPRTTT